MGTIGDRATREKRAFASAVRSLARRPRTAAEIEAFLVLREYPAEIVARTLGRLRELRYLDEAAVADMVVRDAERRKLGSRRVARTLARRGVPEEIAASTVQASEEGDLARARALVARRHPGGVGEDPRRREKVLRFLVGRGFPYAVARQATGVDVDIDVGD